MVAFYLGKLLELAGIGITSVALLAGMTEEHAMGKELTMLLIGAAFFVTGRIIESRGAGGS